MLDHWNLIEFYQHTQCLDPGALFWEGNMEYICREIQYHKMEFKFNPIPTNLNGQYSKKSPIKHRAHQLEIRVNLSVLTYGVVLAMGPVLFQKNQ